MLNQPNTIPKSWLAFELNILRRLKYRTVILPFSSEPNLSYYLKRWNARILTNDLLESAHLEAIAQIQNDSVILTEEDVEKILKNVYVPQYCLQNEKLKNWFGEIDSIWFDNIRQNIEQNFSSVKKAMAMAMAIKVGDYTLSFDDETRELRQTLSTIYKKFWSIFPEPFDNEKENECRNTNARDFIAENQADLMFVRLPQAHNSSLRKSLGRSAWREEWTRAADDFWDDLEKSRAGGLSSSVESKSQYLQFLEDALSRASHIKTWAIAHTEDGFISTQELVEAVGEIRPVDTIFTKDFSELTGTKAVIITA